MRARRPPHPSRVARVVPRTARGDRLGGYTHGKCVRPDRIGRARWARAFAWPLPLIALEVWS